MSEPSIVDHQVHWYPRSAMDALAARTDYPLVRGNDDGSETFLAGPNLMQPRLPQLTTDISTHLAESAEAGVDRFIVGPAELGEVLAMPLDDAVAQLDRVHTAYAEAISNSGGRMLGLAALPMQDVGAALRVLDHAVTDVGLHGVSLLTNDEGRSLGDAGLLPVYQRIGELGVPIFLHPGMRTITADRTSSIREEIGLSWVYHTALAVVSLIDNGVFDVVPDLTVVHPHLGGVLPYVVGRIDGLPGSRAEHPLQHYLRRNFYVDTAVETPGAFALAVDTYGIERVVFGSDYPFFGFAESRALVETHLGAEQARRVYANRVPGLPS